MIVSKTETITVEFNRVGPIEGWLEGPADAEHGSFPSMVSISTVVSFSRELSLLNNTPLNLPSRTPTNSEHAV